jgi:FkbM family methyltransferase
MKKIIQNQLTNSRNPFETKRTLLDKIHHRINLILSAWLGSIISMVFLKLFYSYHHRYNSLKALIKRVIWKKVCEQAQRKLEYIACIVNNDEDNIKYILYTSEESMSEEIFSTGNYDKRYFEQALNLFPFEAASGNEIIFFDVGANAGTFTLAALKSKKFKKHIAIEPHTKTFNQLKINLLLNDHDYDSENINLFNCAVDYNLTEIEYEICEFSSGDNRVRLDKSQTSELVRNHPADLFGEADRSSLIVPCRTLQRMVCTTPAKSRVDA